MYQRNKFVSQDPATASFTLPRKMPPTTSCITAASSAAKSPLTVTPSRIKDILLILSFFVIIFLLYHAPSPRPSPTTLPITHTTLTTPTIPATLTPTTRHHILFSIAASSSSFSRRKSYLHLWYNSTITRAFAFLDSIPSNFSSSDAASLPPVIISKDTSRFPYKYRGGLRSAIRVARAVKEAVELNQTNVRWFVFGDDDTVFFVENLVKTLSKYDHNQWFYVGSNSESYEQNLFYSFDMAFGGGGFAISYPLGRVLARVLDSCLMRYAHVYGSDARIFSCLAELGVGLSHERGFHQLDMRGNVFGLLSAHPLSPLVSLHHLDALDPLFPNMTNTEAVEHLFKAANIDPSRILQQTVCYDRRNSLTVSVSWGYAVQVFEGNKLLPDLLSSQRTFMPWRRSARINAIHYMFNMREYSRDPCQQPLIFFMKNVTSIETGIWSNYTRQDAGRCIRSDAIQNLTNVSVLSHKLELGSEEMKAPRRQCCDISPSFNETMVISIRQCGVDELISMTF